MSPSFFHTSKTSVAFGHLSVCLRLRVLLGQCFGTGLATRQRQAPSFTAEYLTAQFRPSRTQASCKLVGRVTLASRPSPYAETRNRASSQKVWSACSRGKSGTTSMGVGVAE